MNIEIAHNNQEYIIGFVTALLEEYATHDPYQSEIQGYHIGVHFGKSKDTSAPRTRIVLSYDIIGYTKTLDTDFYIYSKTKIGGQDVGHNTTTKEFRFLVEQAIEIMIKTIKQITKA